jgi:hypothetical protein
MSAAGTPASRNACLGMPFRAAYFAAYFTKFFRNSDRSLLAVFSVLEDAWAGEPHRSTDCWEVPE